MRPNEFTFHTIRATNAALAEGDATLELLGSRGWEMRGLTTLPDGTVLVGLQRPLDDQPPLPDAPTLAAALVEPLLAPGPGDREG